MDLNGALDKARDYIDRDKPKSALKVLKPLYDSDSENADIVFEMVTVFEMTKEWEKAQDALAKLVQKHPDNIDGWLRLSDVYVESENLPSALSAIESGLAQVRDDAYLISRKARLLADMGNVDEMVRFTDETMTAIPAIKRDVLAARAGVYESMSMDPEPGEAVVKDMMGMAYGAKNLGLALDDLGEIAASDPLEWRILIRRADVYKKLQEYDNAIADYDKVLEMMDEEAEPFRPFLQEQRDACLNGGKNERAHCAGLIKEGMTDVQTKGALSQEEQMANHIAEVMADQCENGNLLGFLEAMEDDPDDMAALSVAKTIIDHARTPDANFQKTDASEFEKSVQRFCDNVEKVFNQNGYTSLGDFEPKGLEQQLGRRTFFRLFVSKDQLTHGSAYKVKPLWPGFFSWLLLRLSGQWTVAKVVELESETADGRFITTNNTGDVNVFSHGEHMDMVALPLNARYEEVFSTHQARLETYKNEGEKLKVYASLDDILKAQERLRLANNAYRERIGFITDEELRTLLGKQYDQLAPRIKKYLQKLA